MRAAADGRAAGTDDRTFRDVVPTALRQFLLGLVLLGMVATSIELYFLEHTESWQQFIPFLTIAIGLLSITVLLLRPSRASVLVFRGVMLLFMAAGLTGIFLHYSGNVEFELEMYPGLTGGGLIWKALKGATPVGAPGFLVQLGLLGMAATYRHPRLARPVRDRELTPEET